MLPHEFTHGLYEHAEECAICFYNDAGFSANTPQEALDVLTTHLAQTYSAFRHVWETIEKFAIPDQEEFQRVLLWYGAQRRWEGL